MKTHLEWCEYFQDMARYYTENNMSGKLKAFRERFENKPAFKNRMKWIDKGVAEGKNNIILGLD
jgi:hypothetical protein